MKRGLVAEAGANASVYEARLERLRERLRDQDAAVALLYGDVYRSDDIAHLTNLCIYWNEGVLAVPADGPPALLAKLSARVHAWMRRTSMLEDLRASQQLPALIASYLDELGAGTVALVDEAWWPADLVAGIRQAAAGRAFRDLPDAVRATRLTVDECDLADLRRAGEIVSEALEHAAVVDGDSAARIAAIERSARAAGARDVLVVCRAADDGGVALELTVQFSNVWAHAARTLGDDHGLGGELQAARDVLRPGVSAADVAARAASGVQVALVHHCDLGTAGDYRPAVDGSAPLDEGAVVSVSVRSGGVVVADTFLLDGDRVAALTDARAKAA